MTTFTEPERDSIRAILHATIGIRRGEVTSDEFRATMRASREAHGVARHEFLKAAAFAADDRING